MSFIEMSKWLKIVVPVCGGILFSHKFVHFFLFKIVL